MSDPVSGPCSYCGENTSDNRKHEPDIEEFIGTAWMFHHDRCRKLSALRMEDLAFRKLKENPDDPARQVLCRVFSCLADKAVDE